MLNIAQLIAEQWHFSAFHTPVFLLRVKASLWAFCNWKKNETEKHRPGRNKFAQTSHCTSSETRRSSDEITRHKALEVPPRTYFLGVPSAGPASQVQELKTWREHYKVPSTSKIHEPQMKLQNGFHNKVIIHKLHGCCKVGFSTNPIIQHAGHKFSGLGTCSQSSWQ